MSLFGIALLILVIIIFLAVAMFVIKNVVHLIINAIIGLLTLFLVNISCLMQCAGDLTPGLISWRSPSVRSRACPGQFLSSSPPVSGSRPDTGYRVPGTVVVYQGMERAHS